MYGKYGKKALKWIGGRPGWAVSGVNYIITGKTAILCQQLNQQHRDTVNNRYQEDAFDGFVFPGIHIKSKKNGIRYQRNAAHAGEYSLGMAEVTYEFGEAYMEAGKSNKIIKDHTQQGGYKTKHHPQSDIVFLKHQNFHVFSSLLFKT